MIISINMLRRQYSMDGFLGLRKGTWTKEEDDLLKQWSLIAGRLPGRTANDVKNYWNTHLQKKFLPNYEKNKNKEINADKKTHGYDTKVIKPRPWTFAKRTSENYASTIIMDNVNRPHQQQNFQQKSLEEDIDWWENLLHNTTPNKGATYNVSGSEGEAISKLPDEDQEGHDLVQPSNIIGDVLVEDNQSFWRDFNIDMDLWDL
ncbi:hypothetical protein FEM48_Zijuj06G0182200 [Ziziphus jujuba var. spinosa]|uniref:Uncharacterized protein n=1 Tax=Ziziphus jujuba var. spinosa TaxID=714518 RepID=A0A978VAU9_ZIZJJ|nr:hypothetical protein FEM48_Zijuj06G0182200 [Ziziphus jujuba var. spinosa]